MSGPATVSRLAALDADHVNQATWERPATVASYQQLHGWTDPGEQAAVARVAPEICGLPILDIGVGAGRTTALLRSLGGEYVGIDYTAPMVAACQQAYPDLRFEQMDARDLRRLPAGHFGLAMFSFNGIDSVPPVDRPRILAEVHRVLRPGGLFILSAHNRHGPGTRERPRLQVPFSFNPLRLGWRFARQLRSLPRAMRNHQRLKAANELHDDWAVLNAGAHDFGLVIVYTSLAEQRRQLAAGGFMVEAVFDNLSGSRIAGNDTLPDVWWFHYVARKPAAPVAERV
jgi:SAM-dependent methyltransferase